MMIPNRKEYLQQQAQAGQKIMGVLPALYPKELLWAFDIISAEIWDPPGEILKANAHLQATICPVVKRGLEFILKDSTLVNSGYLFPHTCDSLQNLGSQVRDLIGTPQPVYTFYNPKGTFNNATQNYYLELLRDFQSILEAAHGPLDPEKLIAACELGFAIDEQLLKIQSSRLSDQLDLTNLEYFQILRAGEYLSPEDYFDILSQVKIADHPAHSKNKRLLLSGILPPDAETLSLLDELGVTIVAEDLLSGSRRLPIAQLDAPADPYEYLADRHFILPPCSTRASSLDERFHHLNKLISTSNAQGVLFNIVKFCEPELFDHRYLVKTIKKSGTPILSIETELLPGMSGQDRTRIEAFTEMLDEGVLV